MGKRRDLTGLPELPAVRVTQANHKPEPSVNDWHRQKYASEPRCSALQWRTRDRSIILFISEMTDKHLGHCIRFASTKKQHHSRLAELLRERSNRVNYEERD